MEKSILFSLVSFKGDHLLVIGGLRANVNRLSDIELLTFDENDNECSVPDLDETVEGHASVASSRGVITCGGFRHHQTGEFRPSSKCSILYNGEVSSFPSMTMSRSDFGMLNVNGTLYAIAGLTYLNAEPESPYTMETINLKYGIKWEQEKIPFQVDNHCTVNIGSKIYVLGGLWEQHWVREIV